MDNNNNIWYELHDRHTSHSKYVGNTLKRRVELGMVCNLCAQIHGWLCLIIKQEIRNILWFPAIFFQLTFQLVSYDVWRSFFRFFLLPTTTRYPYLIHLHYPSVCLVPMADGPIYSVGYRSENPHNRGIRTILGHFASCTAGVHRGRNTGKLKPLSQLTTD